MNMQVIGRSSGRSAVAAAAYRSGESLEDLRQETTFDYSRRQTIDHTEIMAPANAPAWMHDREQLWNGVEATEKRKDAQLAREFNVALPAELSPDDRLDLLRGYVQSEFVDRGMVADVSLHDGESHNPHGHVMLTMREIEGEGFGKKNRHWNKTEMLESWRESWADHCNDALEDSGFTSRVDHRTLQAQGIDRKPEIHLGYGGAGLDERGEPSRQADRLECVERQNRFIQAFGETGEDTLVRESETVNLYQQYREQHAGRIPDEPARQDTWRRHLERESGDGRGATPERTATEGFEFDR